MNVASFVLSEFDETTARLTNQVWAAVPLDRHQERLPGANSVTWITYHVARHAALALSIVDGTAGRPDSRLDAFAPDAVRGGSGLQEVEQPWSSALSSAAVNVYATEVFADVRRFIAGLADAALDARIDVSPGLMAAGVDTVTFGWLHRLWGDKPLAFLVRWPLVGHVTHHVGELTGIRNQMGLSPFR